MSDYKILTVKKCSEFEMECIHFGKGKIPFVIIPGISLKPVILSAPSVVQMYNEFCEDFDIYLFERRTQMPSDYTVFQMAEDTAEAFRILGIKDACIFGTSQGGMIAQYIAINHPELVSKLVLASTCAKINQTAQKVFENWLDYAVKRDYEKINECLLFDIFSDSFVEKNRDMLMLLKKEDTSAYCQRFEIQTRACFSLNTYDNLNKIKCPVLVIGAMHDKILTPQASVEIAEKLGCRLYMYENYGHAVYDEAPDYKARLLSFFKN